VAAHGLTPLNFADGKDAPLAAGFGWREYRDVDLNLSSVGGIVHDTGPDLTGRRPEEGGARAQGIAAAEGLEL
jgi:hypothetical protein